MIKLYKDLCCTSTVKLLRKTGGVHRSTARLENKMRQARQDGWSVAIPIVVVYDFDGYRKRRSTDPTSLADQFSKNHDEQLTYDNPPTSKNSDGFSL